jgi:hypothetical protein
MNNSESKPKKRRWWLIVLGTVATLVVLVVGGAFAIGSMIGEEFTSTVSMSFDHPPQAVWDAIADYERNPVSATMRIKTTPLPDVESGPSWEEDIGSSVLTITTLESDEPNRVVRFFKDGIVPMTSRVEYVIVPEPDGSKVTMSGLTVISDGTWHVPLFRLMLSLAPDAGSLAYLTELRAHLDADFKEDGSADELP